MICTAALGFIIDSDLEKNTLNCHWIGQLILFAFKIFVGNSK